MKKILLIIFTISLVAYFIVSGFGSEPESVVVSDSLQSIIKDKEVVNSDKPLIEQENPEKVKENSELVVENREASNNEALLEIQAKVDLNVPFIVQAPFGDWSEEYKEACEEASVLMIAKYHQNVSILSQQEMKTDLDKLIPWGLNKFVSYDTSVEDTASFFTDYLEYDSSKVHVVYDITIEDIKAMLSEGYPVIVPAAGRELGNKFFKTPGPLYHMLVITGYDNNQFFTNDPGTRNGEGYKYKQEVLYNAIHDLTPNLEQITEGRKAMIIVKP